LQQNPYNYGYKTRLMMKAFKFFNCCDTTQSDVMPFQPDLQCTVNAPSVPELPASVIQWRAKMRNPLTHLDPDSGIRTLVTVIQNSHQFGPQEDGRSMFGKILNRRAESFTENFPFAWVLVLCSLGLDPHYDGTDHNKPHFRMIYDSGIYPKKVQVVYGDRGYPCDSAIEYLKGRNRILESHFAPHLDKERHEIAAALSLIAYMERHYKPWLIGLLVQMKSIFLLSCQAHTIMEILRYRTYRKPLGRMP